MNAGAVVVTNLDDGSPEGYRHLHTVIDVANCTDLPTDAVTLARIGQSAAAEAKILSWDALAERLVESDSAIGRRVRQGLAKQPAGAHS